VGGTKLTTPLGGCDFGGTPPPGARHICQTKAIGNPLNGLAVNIEGASPGGRATAGLTVESQWEDGNWVETEQEVWERTVYKWG